LTRPAKAVSLSTVRRLGRRLAVVLVVGVLTGCGSNPSPTLDSSAVVVAGENLVPVSVQICHVRGTILNAKTDSGVTIFMRWQAYDAGGNVIATTALTVANVPALGQVSFESTGFASSDRLIGCSAIVRFNRIETTVSPG